MDGEGVPRGREPRDRRDRQELPDALDAPAAPDARGARGAGRRMAFEALFRDNYTELVRLASFLVDDRGVAEEVVQEAFMRLFRRWDRLTRIEAAPAYLRTTVVNLSRSRLRRRAVRRRHTVGPFDPEPAADLRLLMRDDEDVVRHALARLPRRQRECVVLRYYVELSEGEIAATLGISRGAVKSHTSRAIAALSVDLGDES